MTEWRQEAQKDTPEIEGLRIMVLAEDSVMVRGKDWKKRLLRRKARIGWWLANAGTRCKAKLSSH